jgi:hypothetical protein
MTPSPYLQNSPPLTADRGRWCLPVAWDLVPVVYDHLRLRGCRSTLCLDVGTRTAHLMLWPGTDPWTAAGLLCELTGQTPPAPLLRAA